MVAPSREALRPLAWGRCVWGTLDPTGAWLKVKPGRNLGGRDFFFGGNKRETDGYLFFYTGWLLFFVLDGYFFILDGYCFFLDGYFFWMVIVFFWMVIFFGVTWMSREGSAGKKRFDRISGL